MSHRYGDERIVEWLRENRYHPRSPAHGSASCMFLLDDLLSANNAFREAAESGDIVFQEDFDVGSGASRWNTDLVVGPPAENAQIEFRGDRAIAEGEPERVWLAIDAKSVMTEHGKARRNRQRDINSFADIMHRHYPGAVTGGVLLINMAEQFRSPLRDEGDITEHDRIERLVRETVEMFRDIERANGKVSPNVDGVGCIVVDHTNSDDGSATALVEEPPAPQTDDMVHYREFVNIIASVLDNRWLTGTGPDLDSFAEVDLESVLNRQIVEVASAASTLGKEAREQNVSGESVDSMSTEIGELQAVIEEIDRRYGEEGQTIDGDD
ncbi:hypothetical protein BRC97_10145 [Halobacteriales archaeon QS_6_71_20]|nr:MAG: hypothetical protein BRC97_10145 [Halobacteriales archaeon QS_6_71_20]